MQRWRALAHHVSRHDKAGIEKSVPSCIHGCSCHSAAGAEVEKKLHTEPRYISSSREMHRSNTASISEALGTLGSCSPQRMYMMSIAGVTVQHAAQIRLPL